MDINEKKIYLVLSPHINYYHSYRGDSRGLTGFGKDLEMMRGILDKLETIEDMGFSFGNMRISWDYGDTFYSIQLQKEYQSDVLDRVIERCKKGKDEVLIGSWGNVAKSILDVEEFIQDHQWFLENSMGIGVNQLFPGRVAPYARTQETMFTQGMIEIFNQLGIEGICNYYSVYGFDVSRPFLNPRLDWNQRYGLVKFNSTLSGASCIMIPTYAFGDILDFCSIKRWLNFIRKRQESGEIDEHALIFLNFDMDYENWVGLKLSKFLSWMPNSRGLMEFAEAVDLYEYVEFANLLDVVPKLKPHGETTLRQDVADGMWNGYYNWAQKYDNTLFWTVGQRARWLKCISDTLITRIVSNDTISAINKHLRSVDDTNDTYLKNKILFASTTNYGMAMPFLHSDRRKTAMSYGIKSIYNGYKAVEVAVNEFINNLQGLLHRSEYSMTVLPITNRGISERELISISDFLYVKTILPTYLNDSLITTGKGLKLVNLKTNEEINSFGLYNIENGTEESLKMELLLSKSWFESNLIDSASFALEFIDKRPIEDNRGLFASRVHLKNRYLGLDFNATGKIVSFRYENTEFACPQFLETVVSYGKTKNPKTYFSQKDTIIVLRDGSDGFSASIKILSEFTIEREHKAFTEKILTLYADLPYLFITVRMELPEIKGKSSNIGKSDGTSYFVEEQYQEKWQEVIPCEIRPNIIGKSNPLKIWKRNFLGVVDYFNLDMNEVDFKNANIDCLVANVSDGWMGLSNDQKGFLVGFNSLKAANFAFSPLKIRDKGFKDIKTKGQQVRINPFGTYFGKILHYWTDGNGHAQKIVSQLTGTDESTAPTFSGKTISFDLVICPFIGDTPPKATQEFIDHFSLGPLVIFKSKYDDNYQTNYDDTVELTKDLVEEYQLQEVMNLDYLEWVNLVNKDFTSTETKPRGGIPKISLITMIKMLIDGIKGR